jgi:NADPH:quinone reductase
MGCQKKMVENLSILVICGIMSSSILNAYSILVLEGSKMRALLSRRSGGPETLAVEQMPEPAVSNGEVLVGVRACGINFPDTLIIEDLYQYKPLRPFSPGGEVAGVVEAVGRGVTGLAVGDHVIATCLWGGMAEKVVFEQHRCIPIPSSMPFDEAAAFLLTFGTSYYALKERGGLKAGETVIVLGGAGGIGLASIALAKAMGARVVAAVSSAKKAQIASDAGADLVVIYDAWPSALTQKAFTLELKAAIGTEGAHVIVDAVGGLYSEAALRAIGWGGRFLVVGFPAGIPAIPLNLTLLKSCQIIGVFWGAWVDREPEAFRASTRELLDLYEKSLVRPAISGRFRLEDAGEAFLQLKERTATGKLVVVM